MSLPVLSGDEAPPDPLWVFGYGSLVWRPDIPHSQAVPARLDGWVRRFWQASTDHRGVPGAPGVVATLVRAAEASVVGRAYLVPATERDAILERLDHRERGGYARDVQRLIPLRPEVQPMRALVYRATPDNPNWMGERPIESLASQIVDAVGPSGPNPEYVLRLYEALHAWDAVDPHLEALTRAVRERLP